MKPNKKKKIIIISIIVVVLLLIMGIVYAFVGTDLMKSNKDMFFKYASQIFDEQNGFLDARMQQYNEKKKSTVYENYGDYSINLTSENLDEETLENINNLNISFKGNTDNLNDRMEELIEINYSDDAKFSMLYKKIEDTYGLKLNEVAKQFVIIEKDNLGQLLENLDITNMDDALLALENVDISNLELDNEIKNKLKETYLPEIQNSFEDSDFTKVKTEETEGYALEISSQKFKEIFVKLLDVLKTDEMMLNKLSGILGQEIQEQDIESLISYINSVEVSDGNAIITVYQNNGKLRKLELQINDEIKIEIEKTTTDDELEYNVQLTLSSEAENTSINFIINYSGLQSLEDIKENYTINIIAGDESTTGFEYNFNNEIKFIDSAEIADFAENDSLVLTDLTKDKLNSVLEQLGNKIAQVNEQKLKQVGIKGENPIIYMIPGLSQGLLYTSSNEALINSIESNGNIEQPSYKENTLQNEIMSVEDAEKATFNNEFLIYEGENIRGTDVKSLVMKVIASNMAYEDRQIQVTGDIKIINEEVPNNIETTKNYKVKILYGDDDYINEIKITEQE